ncbi:MAG: hypothetical protein IIW16_00985, partial [Clostridia bacterium]|nr:hypothetical protein [Clostridia bacterium]
MDWFNHCILLHRFAITPPKNLRQSAEKTRNLAQIFSVFEVVTSKKAQNPPSSLVISYYKPVSKKSQAFFLVFKANLKNVENCSQKNR